MLRECVDLIGYHNERDDLQTWGAAKEADVSVQEVRRAYSESLDIVLEVVEQLLTEINRKSVVTSDHGEMLAREYFRSLGSGESL